ncbi:hypothetical protein OCU04_005357 [Sclerotinia nivalis]|uniref:Uncharacterized protein n=1 Tax=Sclerotinia nivalis TaxID=352851 RepID=A0A9X0APV6_9HELO|nr:hypothetical protein OCU04_005357 [Sclerotinia nivalis]
MSSPSPSSSSIPPPFPTQTPRITISSILNSMLNDVPTSEPNSPTTITMQNTSPPTNYHNLTIPQLLHLLSERKIKPSFKDALIVLLLFDDENHHSTFNGDATTHNSFRHTVDLQSAGTVQGRSEQEKQAGQARQGSPDLDVRVDGDESNVLIDFEDMQHLTGHYAKHD